MKIINKKVIANFDGIRIIQLQIKAPLIAQKAEAGQFVIVMVSEVGS